MEDGCSRVDRAPEKYVVRMTEDDRWRGPDFGLDYDFGRVCRGLFGGVPNCESRAHGVGESWPEEDDCQDGADLDWQGDYSAGTGRGNLSALHEKDETLEIFRWSGEKMTLGGGKLKYVRRELLPSVEYCCELERGWRCPNCM